MILIGPKICLNLEKKLIEKQSKIIEHLRLQKNFFFLLCIKWLILVLKHGLRLEFMY